MTKQFFLLISIAVLLSSCFRSGYSDLVVKAPFIKLPQEKLGDSVRTYSVDIDRQNIQDLYALGNSFASLQNKVSLKGFKEDSKSPDVMISMYVGTGYFYDKGMKTSTRMDKEGNPFEVYQRELAYSNLVSYRIYRPDSSLIHEVIVVNRDKRETYQSSSFKTIKECDEWWYKNGNTEVNEIKSSLIKSGFEAINTEINQHFGFLEATSSVDFRIIKDENHRDFKKFYSNNKIVESAFNQLKTSNTEKYRKKIQPAIEFWINKLPEYNESDESFIRYACLFNISMAYYWMDDFDRAKNYAALLIAEETNDVEANRVYDLIERTEKQALKLGLPGTHFQVPESWKKSKK